VAELKTGVLKSRPETIHILGYEYSVEYVDKPSEVDLYKRDSLWGQIDFWTRSIRVLDNGRGDADVWESILHETLHGVVSALRMGEGKVSEEHTIELLALGLVDTFSRNGWIA